MVTIITDGISDEQKATAEFKSACRDMLTQLTAPGFAHVLSCHEAAHLSYFRILGTKNYQASPARLFYDPAIRDYSGSMATVRILDMDPVTNGSKVMEWLAKVACAHAAGGVVARRLMSATGGPWLDPTGGDQNDKENLNGVCKTFTAGGIPIDADKLWEAAQDSVLQDLKESLGRLPAIEELAAELRPKLGL
ncbi:MAG: hypothetical protein WA824_02110 [Candidatus Sulfotelmatobacter sp.]